MRRSPLPKLIGERKWKRLVGEDLAPAIADLVLSSAMGGGKTRGVLAVPHDAGAVTLHPVVEPLQVQEVAVDVAVEPGKRGGLHDVAVVGGAVVARDRERPRRLEARDAKGAALGFKHGRDPARPSPCRGGRAHSFTMTWRTTV